MEVKLNKPCKRTVRQYPPRKQQARVDGCTSGGSLPLKRSSSYRGVTRHRWTGRFEAHLWDKSSWNDKQHKKGRQVYLGAYDDEASAAQAYDLAALKYWGPAHPRIESYSAFRDIWAKSLTELPALLKGQGITDLYFAGVAGDYCVKYTALDAVDFGYKTWLIKDAVKSISEDLAMKELADKGVQFTTIKEVKELLAPNALDASVN